VTLLIWTKNRVTTLYRSLILLGDVDIQVIVEVLRGDHKEKIPVILEPKADESWCANHSCIYTRIFIWQGMQLFDVYSKVVSQLCVHMGLYYLLQHKLRLKESTRRNISMTSIVLKQEIKKKSKTIIIMEWMKYQLHLFCNVKV
jgi:transcriptional regulator